jgi:hypothetical protein
MPDHASSPTTDPSNSAHAKSLAKSGKQAGSLFRSQTASIVALGLLLLGAGLLAVLAWAGWLAWIQRLANELALAMNLPGWLTSPVAYLLVTGIGFAAWPAMRVLYFGGAFGGATGRDYQILAVGLLVWAGASYLTFNNTPMRRGCNEADACFGPAGQPLRWYSVDDSGAVVLWNKPGRHPTRNNPLLPVNAAVIETWERQQASSQSKQVAHATTTVPLKKVASLRR